jgi:hypothetical protein
MKTGISDAPYLLAFIFKQRNNQRYLLGGIGGSIPPPTATEQQLMLPCDSKQS